MKFGFTLSGRKMTGAALTDPTPYQTALLGALQNRKVYQGTANQNAVNRRRAANKRASQQRRRNR